MRLGCDTGGTFTDLVVDEGRDGEVRLYKAPTTPEDPVRGVLDALELAAKDAGETLEGFLGRAELFVHGTTHAINAVITGRTARTALLVTEGHPEILTLREGGRIEPFNFRVAYPAPYIPRRLTYEVPERIAADGRVVTPLDEGAVAALAERLAREGVEAVAVCLLWSIRNPAHELRVAELLAEALPELPVTLSHRLNPTLREYRRASSAAIDASLKPLMARYLGSLTERLAGAGFNGRTLVLTSQGGAMAAGDLAGTPIQSLNSGPSMAPVAGRYYAGRDGAAADAIVADTGGTTFDVSLVRGGRIPMTRETWLGQPYRGHMTGFPSIDIKSVGAGGGSIARVDSGGVLHVGPESAGAVPGPVCYGAGGTEPTLTDACLVLGHLDAGYFLGGRMALDLAAAEAAIAEKVAGPLGLSTEAAAAAILELATENMVQAIAEITVNQGIDPAGAVLVGGGGAAGFNAVLIARRLGCPEVVLPDTGAALSAAGAAMSDLHQEYRAMHFTTSAGFDYAGVAALRAELEARCRDYAARAGRGALEVRIAASVDARYAGQVWEIELPLPEGALEGPEDLAALVEAFHALHEQIFAVRDPGSAVEFVGWTVAVSCRLSEGGIGRVAGASGEAAAARRGVFFPGRGRVETPVLRLDALEAGVEGVGPAIIESPFTTVVVDPEARFRRSATGSLILTP